MGAQPPGSMRPSILESAAADGVFSRILYGLTGSWKLGGFCDESDADASAVGEEGLQNMQNMQFLVLDERMSFTILITRKA